MIKNMMNTGLSWLWLTLICLVVDQVTKHLVVDSMELYQSIEVLSFFNITYVHNLGAAFSFLADQGGWQRWFFTTIAAIASIIFIVWLAKTPKENKLLSVAFALLLSGAMGNLIDRALFGYVIDFLDFHGEIFTFILPSRHWPAFNVADSAIFVGAALMIYESFTNKENEKNTEINKAKR